MIRLLQCIPRRLWVALYLLLTGCASVPVVLPTDLPPEQWETAQTLGVPLHEATLEHEGMGQIVVEYVAEIDGCKQSNTAIGCASRRKVCFVRVQVKEGAPHTVLAHEIGHGLILSHSPDAPHNIMAPDTGGANIEVTEEQRLLMRLGSEVLRTCRQIAKRRNR